jgi:hypothetical protein
MTKRERRIRRLLHWYPKRWREGHAEEFSALLEDSISERSFWPRRGIDIAVEGSKLRLGAFGSRLAGVWFELSFAIFGIYAVLFVTVSLPNASHDHFRSLFQVIGIMLASGLIATGLLVLSIGVRSIRSAQSIHRIWPYVSLGLSLISLVGLDGWSTRGGLFWAEAAISQAVTSLYPPSWRSEFSHPLGLVWYLPVTLFLIIVMTASAVVIGRRATGRLPDGAPLVKGGALILMTATMGVSWTWAINVVGALPDRYFIPCMITLAGVSTLLARLHGRRAFTLKQGDAHI